MLVMLLLWLVNGVFSVMLVLVVKLMMLWLFGEFIMCVNMLIECGLLVDGCYIIWFVIV